MPAELSVMMYKKSAYKIFIAAFSVVAALAIMAILMSNAARAQNNTDSDTDKAKAFFKDNVESSVKNYATTQIEQSLSERFNNVEIEIGDIDGEDTRISLFTIQPIWDNPTRATFFQGSLLTGQEADTLNLGLGQRWILNDGKVITGLNIFYDTQWDVGHERVSVGAEMLSSVGDIRINNYSALSDAQIHDGASEAALDGYDAELALPLPYLPNTRIHAKAFAWDAVDGADDLEGSTISVKTALPFGFELEAGSTAYDNSGIEAADFVLLTFNIARFQTQAHVQQPILFAGPAYQLTDIRQRRFEKVRRQNRIVVQTGERGLAPQIGTTAGTINFKGAGA